MRPGAWLVLSLAATPSLGLGLSDTPSDLASFYAQRAELEQRARDRRPEAGTLITPTETAANATLLSEVGAIKKCYYEPHGGDPDTVPFTIAKESVRKTRLFQWLHEMPKGSLLHSHLHAMVDPKWIVANVTYRPYCYIQTRNDSGTAGVPDAAHPYPEGSMRFMRSAPSGHGWRLASELRSEHPKGPGGFDDWLVGLLTPFSDFNVFHLNNDQWVYFLPFFWRVADGLLYKPVAGDQYAEALKVAVRDWKFADVEIRCCSPDDVMYDLDGKYSYAEYFDELKKASDSTVAAMPGVFFGSRVIVSQTRSESPSKIAEGMRLTIEQRRRLPEFIAGYDLVGEEDGGHRLEEFAPQLLDPFVVNASLPFFFHAGETDWRGAQTTGDNVFDAALLSERVGHGLAFASAPVAVEAFKARGGCVEVCPISNQLLQYVVDLRTHPAVSLLAQGLDVVISNDDPAILGTTDSMGWDWWAVVSAWAYLDLRTVKHMCKASISHSRASPALKQKILQRWEEDWAVWVGTLAKDSPGSYC
eukprot:Hpha_TRINITY_DN22438_c0_g1::TRINITY_DN22438_c0_g1_i1::g.95026::m.95026/K19572/CECR1, ADA2; adenosine deaminase CECR1